MTDDVMRVELTTSGVDRSVQQIERLAAAYDRLGDAEARIGNLTGGSGGGGGAGAGSRNAVGRGPAAAGFLTGPRHQLATVEAQIRRAAAEHNLLGGLRGLGGAGGAAAGVAGLGAGAGLAGAALALAAAKAAAFAHVVQQTTQSLAAFGQATGMSGGTSAGVGALVGGGVDVGDIAARGARIRGLRSSSPWAMQLLGYARPFELSADQDNAAQLQQAMTLLRGMRAGSPEQLRAARILGQEDLLARVNVSDPVRRMQDETGRLAGRAYDPASLAAQRDLTEMQRLMIEQWKLLTVELGKPAVRLMTDSLKDLNAGFTGGRNVLRALGGQLDATFGKENLDKVQATLGGGLAGSIFGPLGAIAGAISGFQGASAEGKPEDIQKKQLAELEKLNRQVDQGIHGGGPHAQHALPAHLRGWYLEEAGRGRYRRYGSIGI